MSRPTISRVLDEADLKPHKSDDWLNSHDPDFDAKSLEIRKLYLDAPMPYRQGRLVIRRDEKTGMRILERKFPTKPARPGMPANWKAVVRDLAAEARTHHPKLAIPLWAYLKGYGAWMAAKEAVVG